MRPYAWVGHGRRGNGLVGGHRLAGAGQHLVQHPLQGHGVAADAPVEEVGALAAPDAGVELHGVGVVVAVEGGGEALDADPLFLFGIAPGLVDFADEAGVHNHLLSLPQGSRAAARRGCAGGGTTQF